VNPGGELEPRISLTLPALVDCRRLYLHFTGEEKWRVYRDAIGGRESLPIGEVMRRVGPRGAVYWAP
jgi:6-phosphogluconolactonase